MTTHDSHRYDAVVIGAGLAGLTAATQLAQAGRRILVLERNGQVGGRARTDDLDGWLFNQGGHALYRNGLGHRTLRGLGVEPDGAVAPLRGAQVALDDNTTAMPTGALSLLRTGALSARGKMQFAALLTKLPRLDPADYATVTVDEWLAPIRPDVRQVLNALVRLSTYCADTDIMSADAAISQLAAGGAGVLYLHGGWAALCEQLVQAASAQDAVVRCEQRVQSIAARPDGHRVVTDTDTYTATTVVVAAGGPSLTAALLGLETDHFGAIGPAPKAAVLDLALDAMPARHRFVLGVHDPVYFSVHSPPARLAPEGKVAAVAMRYLHRDDAGSADAHRASLEQIAGLAGTGAPVRSRFLRRMTVTNGQPVASLGGLAGRPGVAVRERAGTFIAGDWVGGRGLLADAAIASGHEAARAAEQIIGTSRTGTLV